MQRLLWTLLFISLMPLHCGEVTCLIQATSRRQQQQHPCCYYSFTVTQDHAEPCSSHTCFILHLWLVSQYVQYVHYVVCRHFTGQQQADAAFIIHHILFFQLQGTNKIIVPLGMPQWLTPHFGATNPSSGWVRLLCNFTFFHSKCQK